MRIRRLWIAALTAVTALLGATGGTARAAAESPIAIWAMDEPAGSRTMYDSSGHGLDGRIGGEAGVGSGFYRFARLDPDTPPTHPEHLVTVPSSRWLDPDGGDFAVVLRLRTTYQFGNIIQKGQATVPGGSWKLQIPNGYVQCWFRGSAGSVLVTAPRKINDGVWHVVRCARTDDGVSLDIDGRTVAEKYRATGWIANSWPLSIGGKTECDQRTVGCDYYAGDLDYVAIER